MKIINIILLILLINVSFAWQSQSRQVYNFYINTEYRDVADIITAMSILESDWYKHPEHKCRNNFLGIRRGKNKKSLSCNNMPCKKSFCRMHIFSTYKEGLQHVLGHFRQHKFQTDRAGFLEDIKKYSKDHKYKYKILKIVRRIKMPRIVRQTKKSKKLDKK